MARPRAVVAAAEREVVFISLMLGAMLEIWGVAARNENVGMFISGLQNTQNRVLARIFPRTLAEEYLHCCLGFNPLLLMKIPRFPLLHHTAR